MCDSRGYKRCNKICGIRWLKNDVRNIKINIKIRPQDGVISLPNFEDYLKKSQNLNLEEEDYVINWQEKLFSLWEIKRYSDIHNCITDNELKYHDMVENLENTPSKIFTYTNDDEYLPFLLKRIKKIRNNLDLSSYFEKLSLNEGLARVLKGSSSDSHLFRSEDNISEEEEWTAMHVMFDTSEYVEDSELIFKQEEVLLSMYYNTMHNYILLNPDVNNLELNPYTIDTVVKGRCYKYSVDVLFNETPVESADLVALLKKLHRKWEKQQKHLYNFVTPPPDKKYYLVLLQILMGKGFDMDDLYIDFEIKMPDDMYSHEKLKGKTHISRARLNSNIREWVYAHTIEMKLEMLSGIGTQPLKLFMEVISRDSWWGRHSTQGYCYVPIHLNPGRYKEEVDCRLPQDLEGNGESLRFFVGGCHLLTDLNVLAEPQMYDTNFTYKSTGSITVEWQILKQQGLSVPRTPRVTGSSTASALLLEAETAISRYKKARSKLAHATRQVVEDRSEAFGDG